VTVLEFKSDMQSTYYKSDLLTTAIYSSILCILLISPAIVSNTKCLICELVKLFLKTLKSKNN